MSISHIAVATLFTLKTPDGPFSVVARPDAVVLASGWTTEPRELTSQIHRNLQPVKILATAANPVVKDAVDAFYAGQLAAIDQIQVLQESGSLRSHAWQVLREVPAGRPITYSQYAELAGNPRAVRAAASACASNAVALFVPCHRVVRQDGGLGGFRWGLEIKQSLLQRESATS